MHKLGRDGSVKLEYISVKQLLDRPLTQDQGRLIDDLQKKFSWKDLYFDKNASSIVLNFRTIDLQRFRDEVSTLFKDSNATKELVGAHKVLADLTSKVEQIHSYGIKGGKRIYVGYNAERKVQDRKSKITSRSSYFYAKGNDFSKIENPLPDRLIDKILCGDSATILKEVPENSIDLILTSPPYNFGLGYDTFEDGIDWRKYFDKLFDVFRNCTRVLKYGGRIIVNIQPLFSDYIPSHHIISDFFMREKLIWKGEVLWEKNNYNCKYTAWGSWKSPSNPYLKYTWEFLEIFQKGDLKKPGKKENIDIAAEEFKKWVVAKWVVSPERNMKKFAHPAMFPEELVKRALKLFSFKNDIILDPFNGAGTTTFVAKKLRRRFLGIDISKEYCDTARRRLKEIS